MNSKDREFVREFVRESIIEYIKKEIKEHENKKPFLIPFDCPVCKHETLSRNQCMFDFGTTTTSFIEFHGDKEMTYKAQDTNYSKDSIYCYGCGNYFSKTESTKWVADKNKDTP